MNKGGFGEPIDGAKLQLEYIEMDPSGRYGRVSFQIICVQLFFSNVDA